MDQVAVHLAVSAQRFGKRRIAFKAYAVYDDIGIDVVLVVDDEQAMLDSYQQVLCPERNPLGSEPEMEALAAKLFGEKRQGPSEAIFDLVLCRQGYEAVEAARIAIEGNRPFAVAFIDIRKPVLPGLPVFAQPIETMDALEAH